MTAEAEPLVRIDGLTIRHADGTALVEDARFDIRPGEIVLLMGPSGSGKSTLINTLAGNIGPGDAAWRIEGRIVGRAGTVDLAEERAPVGAVVFQSFALFDTLSVADNLALAARHSPPPPDETLASLALLLRDLEPDWQVGTCSGGQKQRLAIARTLVAQAPVLFLDEPNSGLDPGAATRLARLLRELADRLNLPIVIVAHHFRDLLPVADRALVLDPARARLEEVVPEADAIDAALLAQAPEQTLGAASAERATTPIGRAIETMPYGGTGISARWLGRFFLAYLWQLCLAPSSVLFIALGGIIIGFVPTWFIFQYLPFRDLLLPVIHGDALAGLAFIEIRVMAPMLTAILICARNASIIGSDIGYKVYSDQIKAMRNLRVPYRLYLYGNLFAASAVASVLLVLLSILLSTWTTMMTWAYIFPDQSLYLWRDQYFQRLLPPGTVIMRGWDWLLLKSVPSVLGATAVTLWLALRPKRSVLDISNATAQAIIWGVSFLLIWQSAITIVEFRELARTAQLAAAGLGLGTAG